MGNQYFRIRFTMPPSVLLDPLNRGLASIKETIALYTRQGWRLESVSDRPIGLVDYEIIALMKQTA